jgi:hypothetical protein
MSTINFTGLFKNLVAVGSIAAGSDQLVLQSQAGFAKGDQLIVEVGGEPGQGKRATEGVGGVFAQQDASYYKGTINPKALVAKVLNVVNVGASGAMLVLDKKANVGAQNAKVYFDNWPIWQTSVAYDPGKPVTTEEGVTVTLPAGSFAVSDRMDFWYHKSWKLLGAGDDKTEFFSPKGTLCATLKVFQSANTTAQGFRLRGNVGTDGFGTDWYAGALDITDSHDSVFRDVVIIDCWRGLSVNYSPDTWAYNVRVYLTKPLIGYVSWQIGWANSARGGAVDCGVFSKYRTAGAEAFQSAGTQFIRLKLFNASASSNSSGGSLFEDPYIRLAANCKYTVDSGSRYDPLVNFNRNIDNQQGNAAGLAGEGGRLIRPTIIQDGFMHPDERWFYSGIVVDGACANVSVEGGFYLIPDAVSDNDTLGRGTPGFTTDGALGCIVDGFTSWGRADSGGWNKLINNAKGTVKNSKAALIAAAVSDGNSNDPGPRPVLPPFPDLTPPSMNVPVIVTKPAITPEQLRSLLDGVDAQIRAFFA